MPPDEVVTAELARHISELACEFNRQIGVLLDRAGHVRWVLVGDAQRLDLPDLGRYKAHGGRFNGLRLVHTHLNNEPLSTEDLADLALLRLDLVAVISARGGLPESVALAHLLPPNPQDERYRFVEASNLSRLHFDAGVAIRELEAEFQRRARDDGQVEASKRALLVGVRHGYQGSSEASMAELAELASSAGLQVARSYLQSRPRLDPRFLIGRGKLNEIILDSLQMGADLIIFDGALTPAQARTIATAARVEVLDRNQLILAAFGQRAKTRAGLLQVELASLRYELPRLHRRFEGLSRITGGIGALGPGETKLEIHRRRVRDRIAALEREIDNLGKQRKLRRQRRERRGVPVVAIVGYTNSGKSTLLNHLTASKVLTEDRLFATLDPTSRRIRFGEGRELVLTDTVGFIRDLPADLVQAFRSTLEELHDADLLVHLVDVSNPDHEQQMDAVERILEQLELDDLPRLSVYNKIDLLAAQGIELPFEQADSVCISARSGQNVGRLLRLLAQRIWPEDGEAVEREIGDDARL